MTARESLRALFDAAVADAGHPPGSMGFGYTESAEGWRIGSTDDRIVLRMKARAAEFGFTVNEAKSRLWDWPRNLLLERSAA